MTTRLSTEVVKAVAETKGCEPIDLGFPLEDYIPTDVLQRLASHKNASWTISFEVPDHNVTVTSDGRILVDGTHEKAWS